MDGTASFTRKTGMGTPSPVDGNSITTFFSSWEVLADRKRIPGLLDPVVVHHRIRGSSLGTLGMQNHQETMKFPQK